MLGFCVRTRWARCVLLLLVCWGLFATEAHGILGHARGKQPRPTRRTESNYDPSGILAGCLTSDHEDPFCSICLNYRLVHHGLIPQAHCIADLIFVVQPISLHRTSLVQAHTPSEEIRGPPLA
jgi:hypothetical protein